MPGLKRLWVQYVGRERECDWWCSHQLEWQGVETDAVRSPEGPVECDANKRMDHRAMQTDRFLRTEPAVGCAIGYMGLFRGVLPDAKCFLGFVWGMSLSCRSGRVIDLHRPAAVE